MAVNTVQGEGQQKAVTMGRLLTFQVFAANRIQALCKLLDSELFQNVQAWHCLCPWLPLCPPLQPLPRHTCNPSVISNPQAWSEYAFSSQFRLPLPSPTAGYQHHPKSLRPSPPPSLLLLWDHRREDSPAQCRHIRLLFRLVLPSPL